MATPQIGLSYVESLSSSALDEFSEEVKAPKLDFQSESRLPPGPYAGMEWMLPTAIIVYIGKSYFDAFLKEAGKDHYQLLKAGLKKLAARCTGEQAPRTHLYFTDRKAASETPRYSLVLSVVADLGQGITIKLLLDPNYTAEQSALAIESFLAFLERAHEGTLDLSAVNGLVDARPVGRTLLIAFNTESSALEVVDPIPRHFRDRT